MILQNIFLMAFTKQNKRQGRSLAQACIKTAIQRNNRYKQYCTYFFSVAINPAALAISNPRAVFGLVMLLVAELPTLTVPQSCPVA